MEKTDHNAAIKELREKMNEAMAEINNQEYRKQLIDFAENAKKEALEFCAGIDHSAIIADMDAITQRMISPNSPKDTP